MTDLPLPRDLLDQIEAAVRGSERQNTIGAEDLEYLVEDFDLSDEDCEVLFTYLTQRGYQIDEGRSSGDQQTRGSRHEVVESKSSAGDDGVSAYLTEIGHTPLLNPDDEIRLARILQKGLLAGERLALHEAILEQGDKGSDDRLTTLGQRRLKRQVQRGELARNELIHANLRLVVSIAKKYRNRGLAFLDLIQEGNLGLIRALERFDPERGFKISTYATWWIRQAIVRAIGDQVRTIRIPVHVMEHITQTVATQRRLTQDLGRDVSVEELAAELNETPEKIREYLRLNQTTVSLEQPIGDGDYSLSDIIQDASLEGPEEEAAKHLLEETLHGVLGDLDERERLVVGMRFGLNGGRAATLEEVGREFGITRERVRQIEAKTMAKLRRPENAAALRAFLGVSD